MTASQHASQPTAPAPATIAAIRRFNRFWTRVIGALDEGHLHSPFSLAEVRVLYEIAHRNRPSATAVGRDLRLDAGYVSRMLRAFEERGLVTRSPSPSDGRQSFLALSAEGARVVADLESRANTDVGALVAAHNTSAQTRLVDAMTSIETILAGQSSVAPAAPFLLRPHRPGDMGWVLAKHGTLYADEYQWDMTFEALVARIAADFIDHFDVTREYCWIAERDGTNVGCVFLVRHPERDGVAKLPMLLVDPAARGLGIGKRLVDECTRFARRSGYHTISLWTNDILTGARRLYQTAGYRLVSEDAHHSFGHDLVGQYWELTL